jgi:pre-60S factor REI1
VAFVVSVINRRVDKNSVYNLKRRIASLPPISEMAFHKQVPTSESENDEAEDSSPFEQSCIACEQHYTNRKTWQAHLRSRNHIQKSAENTLLLNSLKEGQPTDEEEQFSPLQCLFCNVESTSLDSNLTHMSHAHSFFIPDAEYLIDMESLLSYLFAIVAVFHECLFCGSLRSNKFAVQDHMRGKGHCKVDFEDDEHQLKQFYDFSGDVDDDGEDDGEELAEGVTLVPDEDELRLPSGKILGHRSRARYFRQNLSQRASSTPSSQQQLLTEAEFEPATIESKDRRVATRAGTSTSLVGVPELQQRALIAVENKMLKIETIARNAYQFKLEKEGNRQKRYKVGGIGKKQGGLEKRNG